MNEEKEKRKRKSLNISFDKFKYDVDNIIDDTKNFIIDFEELENDIKHCSKKYCFRCCFDKLCCFK